MDRYKELAEAVVLKAVEDWRYLCEMGIPSKECNFKEIENFFKRECHGYICPDLAKRILLKLKREKVTAESGPRKVFKRKSKQASFPWVAARGKVVIGCYKTKTDAQDAFL